MVGHGAVDLYLVGVVDYRTVDLYWGRSRRVWCLRSLLGTVW